MWAIIGGSIFEHFTNMEVTEVLDRNTPFGLCSSGLKSIKLLDKQILFLPRHGEHRELLPSEINYSANIFALKKFGASKILSISGAGSLNQKLKPGDMVVPTQYYNMTSGKRRDTFCGDGIVGHVSVSKPISYELMLRLQELVQQLDFTCHFGFNYVCIEGPSFCTQVESKYYRSIGADIIGMTHYPEYTLAREAGICYLPCCFITDYESWQPSMPHTTVATILEVLKENNCKALNLAKLVVTAMGEIHPNGCPDESLQVALVTPWEKISEKNKSWLSLLLNR